MFDATGFSENAAPIERRRHHRQRTFLHGKLVFPAEGTSQDCTIRNLSDTGACLETPALAAFAGGGVVVVTKTGAAHEIGLVWRHGASVGVRFTATHDLKGDTSPRLGHLHRLWIEHTAR